ncbi:hypothetical protein [Kitasatospora sp. NPDC088351]|uniref:hypothetical protein n=1 Tax=Kitasatospora sp. NPDC088351 TaxID=3155180 RepID=UPI00343F46A0
MTQLIGWLLSHARTFLATGSGRRARRPRYFSAIREHTLELITPTARTADPIRPVVDGLRCSAGAHRPHPYGEGASVRPYIDWGAWLAELDEMEREVQREAGQQALRREALAAASSGLPDTGYTYPEAQTLARSGTAA